MSKNKENQNETKIFIDGLAKVLNNMHLELNSHPYLSGGLSCVRSKQFELEKRIYNLEKFVESQKVQNNGSVILSEDFKERIREHLKQCSECHFDSDVCCMDCKFKDRCDSENESVYIIGTLLNAFCVEL